MNEYVSVDRLKSHLRLPLSTREYDSALLSHISVVSRAFDTLCHRPFFSVYSTERWDGSNWRDPDSRCIGMWAKRDIASLTTLKVDENDDGTYETTLTEGTDYRLVKWRAEDPTPYVRIELIPRGTQLSSFPVGYETVEAVGYFGFSNATETLTCVVGTGGITSSATSLPLSTGHVGAGDMIAPGDTLVIESEHMAVTDVTPGAATVVRGINGTTAAAHSAAVAMSRRTFPLEIVQATEKHAARLFREAQGGHAGQLGDPSTGISFTSFWDALRQEPLVQAYRQMVVV